MHVSQVSWMALATSELDCAHVIRSVVRIEHEPGVVEQTIGLREELTCRRGLAALAELRRLAVGVSEGPEARQLVRGRVARIG